MVRMEDLLLVRTTAGVEWRSFLEEDLLHSATANGQNGGAEWRTFFSFAQQHEQNGGASSSVRTAAEWKSIIMEELVRNSRIGPSSLRARDSRMEEAAT
ncbi:hypothetical protein SESBI_01846 [Sesbania bispinosa]|nr:hypothetical protein SESBI_01846 [Sesbania bispinosa]